MTTEDQIKRADARQQTFGVTQMAADHEWEPGWRVFTQGSGREPQPVANFFDQADALEYMEFKNVQLKGNRHAAPIPKV